MKRGYSLSSFRKSFLSSFEKPAIKIVGALVVFVSMIVSARYYFASLTVASVELRGAKSLDSKKLKSKLDSLYLGLPFSDIDYAQAKKILKQNKYVAKVFPKKTFDGRLIFEIEEEKPIALVAGKNRETRFLSENGILLPFSNKAEFSDLIVVDDPYGKTLKSAQAAKEFARLIRRLKSLSAPLAFSQFAELKKERRFGYAALMKTKRLKVVLGDERRLEEKISALRSFWKNAFDPKQEYEYIDLRWKDRLIAKKRLKNKG